MNMRGMGCALSIHQKECQKSLGCVLYISARYLSENMVIQVTNKALHIINCNKYVGDISQEVTVYVIFTFSPTFHQEKREWKEYKQP
jgi:hypothetical protein